MSEKLEELTEFETKYITEEANLIKFKKIAQNIEGLKSFVYAEGPDRYYVPNLPVEALFARYRRAAHEKKPTEWLTYKKKLIENRSYKRKEPNIFVTGTSLTDIEAALEMNGYEFNFTIYKYCHIYFYGDAVLVFYTVVDGDDKHTSFIEIEVDEQTIGKKTEEEAWDVVRKYEAFLEPLGITYRNRLQKSLFDMYRKEKK